MTWTIQPEPANEAERAALLQALERALGADGARPSGNASRWWRAGLDDLRGDSAPEEPRSEPGIVEP